VRSGSDCEIENIRNRIRKYIRSNRIKNIYSFPISTKKNSYSYSNSLFIRLFEYRIHSSDTLRETRIRLDSLPITMKMSFISLSRESFEKQMGKRGRRTVTKKYLAPWNKSDSEFKRDGRTYSHEFQFWRTARPFPREICLCYVYISTATARKTFVHTFVCIGICILYRDVTWRETYSSYMFTCTLTPTDFDCRIE